MKKAPAVVAVLCLFAPLIADQFTIPITFAGGDIGAQINDSFTACNHNCAVTIPAGSYTYTTTIKMTKPSESLVGAGSGATILHYTGSGDGIYWQMNPFTIAKAGTLRGFSLVGTSSAQNCIHSGSLQGSTWDDLMIAGCTGANANGILLENACIGGVALGRVCSGFSAWTERTYMHNIHLGQAPAGTPGNTNDIHMLVHGGTYSFGYSDVDVWFNIEANQTGMLVDTRAQPYHSNINIKANVDANPSSVLTVAGNMWGGTLTMFGEAGGGSANLIHVTSTGMVNDNGTAQIWSGSGPGEIATPLVDSGGFYVLSPFADFSYPSTPSAVSPLPYVRPIIETGSAVVSTGETIVIAQASAGDFEGRLILTWPNNANRNASMVIDVACAQFESILCSLNVPVNYAYGGNPVFTSPTIRMTGNSPSLPQLVLTIGNLNGVTQSLAATWIGPPGNLRNNGSPLLFPGTRIGSTTVPLVGTTVDYQGNKTIMAPTTALSGKFNQVSANTIAGTSACAGSTKAIRFSAAYKSQPSILVFDETTKGGASLSAKSVDGFTVSCAGATDAFDWIAIGNPN
ncbi:MAG: hypothetical protein WCC95_14280 [Candidatus Sulfotelmatobacter sp.]|jgi:hypothetical protein